MRWDGKRQGQAQEEEEPDQGQGQEQAMRKKKIKNRKHPKPDSIKGLIDNNPQWQWWVMMTDAQP